MNALLLKHEGEVIIFISSTKLNIASGHSIRNEVFALIEGSLDPDFSAQDFTNLFLKIDELYSTPDYRDYYITAENMSERERGIGLARVENQWPAPFIKRYNAFLTTFLRLCRKISLTNLSSWKLGSDQPSFYVHRTTHAKDVFAGMQIFRIEVLPEFMKALSDDYDDCLRGELGRHFLVSIEGPFIKAWYKVRGNELIEKIIAERASEEEEDEYWYWRRRHIAFTNISNEYKLYSC